MNLQHVIVICHMTSQPTKAVFVPRLQQKFSSREVKAALRDAAKALGYSALRSE